MKSVTYGESLSERMNNGEFDQGNPKWHEDIGTLTNKQCLAVDAFKAEHNVACKGMGHCTDFGGDISIIVSSDGIGQCVHVMCNRCGEIEDITDVDCW